MGTRSFGLNDVYGTPAYDPKQQTRKVEKMIGDLGQMFSRFSTMVAAQEEVVMHIEDDVEAAHAFAEEGQAHLAK